MVATSQPTTLGHQPVMLAEVMRYLKPQAGGVMADATFGGGGYSRAILTVPGTTVYGFDADPAAQPRAQALAKEFDGGQYGERLRFFHGFFDEIPQHLARANLPTSRCLDGLVFDLGLSSFQLDDGMRGFSFSKDGPLDMRFAGAGLSAADVVNTYAEADLANIFFVYGEERFSRRIARKVVERRQQQPLTTTRQLADLIAGCIARPKGESGGERIHPATRCFQALRIFVNDELRRLETALANALSLLRPLGRMVVVSFHSLEDRIVKQFLQQHHGAVLPNNTPAAAWFDILTRKPLNPSEVEIANNPRARSAKLRAACLITPN
ncbi:MAG: 16S rRNA (cytosine(1402)-N(4))-methyltransferase RsmH [Alphaproteobacteria bacterium]|nr:16S rRNA (cytosine(1402)-N(4))-methyltransferase RsmH [Alphaproteobacteria bacterium]